MKIPKFFLAAPAALITMALLLPSSGAFAQAETNSVGAVSAQTSAPDLSVRYLPLASSEAQIVAQSEITTVGLEIFGECPRTAPQLRYLSEGNWSAWQDLEYVKDEATAGLADTAVCAVTEPLPLTGVEQVQVRTDTDSQGRVVAGRLVVVDAAPLPADSVYAQVDIDSVVALPAPDQPAERRSEEPQNNSALPAAENVSLDQGSAWEALLPKAEQQFIPQIASRAAWGADESITTWLPVEYGKFQGVVIHHTATPNNYSPADVPAILRSIQRFQALSRNWGDIGYNVLIDKYGRAWQGRLGDLHRLNVGAHARGANSDTFGISVLGDYTTSAPSDAAIAKIIEVAAWKFASAGLDPMGQMTLTGGLTGKKTPLTVPRVVGHRQVGSTTCPGDAFFARLPQIQAAISRRSAELRSYSFVDTPPGVQFWDVVTWMRASGLSTGWEDGTYRRDDSVSRVATIAFLYRMAGSPLDGESVPDPAFVDVDARSPFARAVHWGKTRGLTQGWPDGTFRPDQPISRAAMAAFLQRFCASEKLCGTVSQAALKLPLEQAPFKDVSVRHQFARPIAWMGAAEISTGWEDGTFRPESSTSRAAMAAFIYRLKR